MRATVLLDLYGTLVEPDWAALLKGRAALAERAGVAAAAAHRAWDLTHAARMTGLSWKTSAALGIFIHSRCGIVDRGDVPDYRNWPCIANLFFCSQPCNNRRWLRRRDKTMS